MIKCFYMKMFDCSRNKRRRKNFMHISYQSQSVIKIGSHKKAISVCLYGRQHSKADEHLCNPLEIPNPDPR